MLNIEWFPIRGYSNYAISKCGKVLNVSKNRLLKGSINPAGYINYRLTNNLSIAKTWGRHRLLAYVFLNPGKDIENLVVNHKDGIKGRDVLNNLEWVSPKENVEHAGRLGLTDKCIPISVRDLSTGELFDFPSMLSCSVFFNLSKDAIAYRVKIGEKRIFPENRQYRKGNSDRAWFDFLDLEAARSRNTTSKSILVKNLRTGEEKTFNKMTDLALFLNVALSTLSNWMLKHHPVVTGFFQLKWKWDTSPWRSFSNLYEEMEMSTGKRIVEVYDIVNDETVIYESLKECSDMLSIKISTLCERLKRNKQTNHLR